MKTVLFLVLLVAAGAFAWNRFGDELRVMYELSTLPAPAQLPVPVKGVPTKSLGDTWHAERSGGRKHQGIDIFARRGTPVLSPVTGLVTDIGHDRLGGNVVRVLGPGRQVHYFAHLDGFGPIREWQIVRAGDVIGYVGNTGNARGTPPHLHYGIYATAGGAINPYPLLAARR